MQSAEDSTHQLRIGAVLVQLQQRRFEIDKDLPRFLAKALLELLSVFDY